MEDQRTFTMEDYMRQFIEQRHVLAEGQLIQYEEAKAICTKAQYVYSVLVDCSNVESGP
jgi:hypothetical protein